MQKKIGFVVILIAALLMLQCSKSTDPAPRPTPEPTPIDIGQVEREILQSSNLFGFKLFKNVIDDTPPGENVFISPLSASFALGMVWEGAAAETKDAMAQTLEMSNLTDEQANQAYQSLMSILPAADPEVLFKIANSIWYRNGKAVRQDYIDICRTYFDALVEEVNFQDPATPTRINNWVDENTNGKITKIIDPPISDDVAMMLLNAIYFKGTWTHLFDTTDTHDMEFHLENGSSTQCRMMKREDDTVAYFHNDIFQAIDLPYGDGSFSMTIFLPNYDIYVPGYDKTVEDVLEVMTVENWSTWMGSFKKGVKTIGVPRFKFSYDVELTDILKAMGMSIAFTPDADFSKMFADGVGWIDMVKQKTFVQVDENGTEAAAVTIVIMIDSYEPGFVLDRPFLFVIHEHQTGAILFMGKIANPVWDE